MAERPHAVIFGAGDVVAKRLLPALQAARFAERYTLVHAGICDVEPGPGIALVEACPAPSGPLAWLEDAALAPDTPVFLATPPDGRAELARAALGKVERIACEKPLYIDHDGRRGFARLGADSERLFAFGYYVQEKAPGWTWLHKPLTPIASVLGLDPKALEAVRALFGALGPLKRLEINICEGAAHSIHPERRFWHQDTVHGPLFDMGVHAVMMALLPGTRPVALSARLTGERRYRLTGEAGGVELDLTFGKGYAPGEVRRQLTARYSLGSISSDFDTGSTALIAQSGPTLRLPGPQSKLKYAALVELAAAFFDTGWPSNGRYDLLDVQMEALDLILPLARRLDAA